MFSHLQLVTNHLHNYCHIFASPCYYFINFLKSSLENKYVCFEGEFGIIIISGIAIPQLWRESNSKTKENKNQALKVVVVTSTFLRTVFWPALTQVRMTALAEALVTGLGTRVGRWTGSEPQSQPCPPWFTCAGCVAQGVMNWELLGCNTKGAGSQRSMAN